MYAKVNFLKNNKKWTLISITKAGVCCGRKKLPHIIFI